MGKRYKDPMTRFRLALLILVDGIVCPTCNSTLISPEHVSMVADVEKFLKYPWGRESFLLTVKSIKGKEAYHLAQDTTAIQGFSHDIVLVTLCCCPEIIERKGSSYDGMEENVLVEDIVQSVIERSLNVNVEKARKLDATGMAS